MATMTESFFCGYQHRLKEMDQKITEERDKRRCRLLGKRPLELSLFGDLKIKRTYYRDHMMGGCVYLSERYLTIEEGRSPESMRAAAIAPAIQRPSYQKAARALESLLTIKRSVTNLCRHSRVQCIKGFTMLLKMTTVHQGILNCYEFAYKKSRI